MNTFDIICIKITESSKMNTNFITNLIDIKKIPDKSNNNKSDWFDRVYLCYENTQFKEPDTLLPIKGFYCCRYNSFENAHIGWENRSELHKFKLRHTMIPICKWIPKIFDKYILNWKLKNMYWGGKISLVHGYNRYK